MATKTSKYQVMASQIVELVGGKDNIRACTNCMTRLRINLKDKGLVELEQLQKLPGCIKTQWVNDQLQVVIGPQVGSVYREV